MSFSILPFLRHTVVRYSDLTELPRNNISIIMNYLASMQIQSFHFVEYFIHDVLLITIIKAYSRQCIKEQTTTTTTK